MEREGEDGKPGLRSRLKRWWRGELIVHQSAFHSWAEYRKPLPVRLAQRGWRFLVSQTRTLPKVVFAAAVTALVGLLVARLFAG